MNISSEIAGLTIIGAVEPTGFFNAFCPALFDVRTSVVQPDAARTAENVRYMRSGYTPALTLSLGLGLGLALLAKSPLPFIAAAISSAYMVHSYETGLPVEHRLFTPIVAQGQDLSYLNTIGEVVNR